MCGQLHTIVATMNVNQLFSLAKYERKQVVFLNNEIKLKKSTSSILASPLRTRMAQN